MPVSTPLSLIRAVSYCMRPVVRLCIHHGIDYRQLTEILKETFVTVADEDFPVPGRKQTDSRISLITGVHRKDVHRLRQQEEDATRLPGSRKVPQSVIDLWLTSPELLSQDKRPIAVPRTAREGHEWSFAKLVAKINQDMPARSVLDELVLSGVLSVDHEDMVHLDPEAMTPNKNIDQKVEFFSSSIHSHIAAAGENLCAATPAYPDRFLAYDNLLQEDADRLKVIADKASMRALKTVNESATEIIKTAQASGKTGSTRIHFGSFFYSKAK